MLVRMVSMEPISEGLLRLAVSSSSTIAMKPRFLSSTRMSKSSAAPATAVSVWMQPRMACFTESLWAPCSWLKRNPLEGFHLHYELLAGGELFEEPLDLLVAA